MPKKAKKTSIATLIQQQQEEDEEEVDVFDTLRGERQTETVREAQVEWWSWSWGMPANWWVCGSRVESGRGEGEGWGKSLQCLHFNCKRSQLKPSKATATRRLRAKQIAHPFAKYAGQYKWNAIMQRAEAAVCLPPYISLLPLLSSSPLLLQACALLINFLNAEEMQQWNRNPYLKIARLLPLLLSASSSWLPLGACLPITSTPSCSAPAPS